MSALLMLYHCGLNSAMQ